MSRRWLESGEDHPDDVEGRETIGGFYITLLNPLGGRQQNSRRLRLQPRRRKHAQTSTRPARRHLDIHQNDISP